MIDRTQLYEVYKLEKNYNTTAAWFGVSRQRIEQLLKDCPDAEVAAIQRYNRLRVVIPCIECHKPFRCQPARRGGLCKACIVFFRTHPDGKSNNLRQHNYPLYCRNTKCLQKLEMRKRTGGYCKPCYSKKYRTIHKQHYQELHQVWYAKNQERLQVANKVYQQEHKEKVNAYQKQYYAANRDKILAYQKQYYRANLEKRRAQLRGYSRKYHQQKKALEVMGISLPV